MANGDKSEVGSILIPVPKDLSEESLIGVVPVRRFLVGGASLVLCLIGGGNFVSGHKTFVVYFVLAALVGYVAWSRPRGLAVEEYLKRRIQARFEPGEYVWRRGRAVSSDRFFDSSSSPDSTRPRGRRHG